MEKVQQLVSTVSPLQGNNERCIDGAKAEANRELITLKRKQAKVLQCDTVKHTAASGVEKWETHLCVVATQH